MTCLIKELLDVKDPVKVLVELLSRVLLEFKDPVKFLNGNLISVPETESVPPTARSANLIAESTLELFKVPVSVLSTRLIKLPTLFTVPVNRNCVIRIKELLEVSVPTSDFDVDFRIDPDSERVPPTLTNASRIADKTEELFKVPVRVLSIRLIKEPLGAVVPVSVFDEERTNILLNPKVLTRVLTTCFTSVPDKDSDPARLSVNKPLGILPEDLRFAGAAQCTPGPNTRTAPLDDVA